MNSFDFSIPQKLDKKAFWIALGKAFWVIGRAIWPIIAILALRGLSEERYWMYAIISGTVLLGFARILIQFLFFTYQLKGDELIIRKGWLNKSETVVTLDKIHEVNLNQKLIHKFIGLYNVSIDTAGSSKTEIEINGIGYEKALALKELLVYKEIDKDTEFVKNEELVEEFVFEKPLPSNKKRIEISFLSLVKIGITRNYIQTFGLMFAFGFQFADQLESIFYKDDESIYDDIYSVASQYYVGFMWMALFIALILFIIVFNLCRTILTYYNYEITIKDKQLFVSYGLTDSHIVSVPSNKVQLFVYEQNYFQKLMNLFEVKIKQVDSSESNKKKKGLVVPGANDQELNEIFQVIYDKALSALDRFVRPHIRLLYRNILMISLLAVLVLVGIWYQDLLQYAYAIVGVYLFLVGIFYLSYKNEKLFIEDDFIILQRGVWDRSTTYLHINKVQQISLSQSYFQEKRQLGSLTLYTAGGNVFAGYYSFETLQQLANEWLCKIEKNKYPWT